MKANLLTRDLSPRRITQICITLTLLVALGLGANALVRKWAHIPKSPEKVRKITRNYLIDKSGTSKFEVTLPGLGSDNLLPKLTNELNALTANMAQLRTNYSVLRNSIRTYEREVKAGEKRVRSAEKRLANLKDAAQNRKEGEPEPDLTAATAELETAQAALKEQENLYAKAKLEHDSNRTKQAKAKLDIRNKERQLSRARYDAKTVGRRIGKEFAATLKEATDYKTVYKVIGDELSAASRKLESDDANDQRTGLSLAYQASDHAIDYAYDSWLAARICEGYIFPHADLYENKGRRRSALESVLYHAISVFRKADEPRNITRSYEILIAQSEPKRADSARFRLAREFERQGEFKDSLRVLNEIESESMRKYAEPRIAGLKQRLDQ